MAPDQSNNAGCLSSAGSSAQSNEPKACRANRSTKVAGKLKVLPDQPDVLTHSKILSKSTPNVAEQEVSKDVEVKSWRSESDDDDADNEEEPDKDEEQDIEVCLLHQISCNMSSPHTNSSHKSSIYTGVQSNCLNTRGNSKMRYYLLDKEEG